MIWINVLIGLYLLHTGYILGKFFNEYKDEDLGFGERVTYFIGIMFAGSIVYVLSYLNSLIPYNTIRTYFNKEMVEKLALNDDYRNLLGSYIVSSNSTFFRRFVYRKMIRKIDKINNDGTKFKSR